ncbi:MAG: DUF1552 domain-containing protein, partial [Planctomycetota bacterium]
MSRSILSKLNRRTVLRGIGTGLALPMLESMKTPRLLAATTAPTAPVRMACIFVANGAIMDKWKPTGEGKDYQLSPILEPLAP